MKLIQFHMHFESGGKWINQRTGEGVPGLSALVRVHEWVCVWARDRRPPPRHLKAIYVWQWHKQRLSHRQNVSVWLSPALCQEVLAAICTESASGECTLALSLRRFPRQCWLIVKSWHPCLQLKMNHSFFPRRSSAWRPWKINIPQFNASQERKRLFFSFLYPPFFFTQHSMDVRVKRKSTP